MTIYGPFHPTLSRGPDGFHHPDDLPKQPLRFPPWPQRRAVSLKALPPIRLAPCSPPAASPAAKSPGTEVAPVASILAPPML